MTAGVPATAEVVIVGGGVIGCSVAYHLTRLGAGAVVLLERERLTSGSSWHAAGLIMQLRSTHAMTRLACGNAEFYARLEAETGQAIGFKRNGTLAVARCEERMHELRRAAGIARGCGVEAHLLGVAEARALYPAIEPAVIRGALFIPGDGQLDPVGATLALAAGARQGGARIVEQAAVGAIERCADGTFRLATARGELRCERLVLCAGLWTRALAARLGVVVPLAACEHMYVVTEPLAWVTPGLPVLRDTDGYCYVKEEAGKALVGAFEPRGKPLAAERLPADPAFVELAEDWDHFALPYGRACEILPGLAEAGIARFLNAPESFTPDAVLAMGEAPGCPGCFVAAGLCSEGFELAPGVGRALAEWIVAGEPTMDLLDVDIARFHRFQGNRRYLAERAAESLGEIYRMRWPQRQREAARPVRRSPLHERLVALRACFGETLGWERALWYAPPGVEPRDVHSYQRPGWFGPVAAEHAAVRERVGLFDVSSFGKLLVAGPDACRALQRLCASDLDVAPGRVVYTHMLNRRGGIEVDLTARRLAEDRYLLVTSAGTLPRDAAWIERHLGRGERVTVTDVTSAYAVLSVQGPRSRALLARVSDADLGDQAFPFASAREIDLGYGRGTAVRLSFVGELGWELYVPGEFAVSLFDLLLEEGRALGLRPAGYHAMEHLRSERGYREFGLDLTPEETPFEAGLGFVVARDKGADFIGREAVEAQRGRVLSRRLVLFALEDPEPVLHGQELILHHGRVVGYLSSAAYGFTLGTSVGMGYVHHPDGVTRALVEAGGFEIEREGVRLAARASLAPFYDPSGERLRGRTG